ncbi:MAG: tRNA (N6-isopentenyl adenosine(37)-C2)-methylthiotransferase MiaB [Clostridia bacterium]|nr:tRNA (N6-isopentenyl adenosine(37)-C2)-methylthiotransferase MiaB [Clostridia bacterium]
METRHVPQAQIQAQYDYAARLKALGIHKKYHIVTMGCQMNVRDSETMSGWLDLCGFAPAQTREDADIIIYNTCCVRENAENKALGNVIWLKELKKDKNELIIGVTGCMMQQEGVSENLKAKYPFIDLVFGTHNAYCLPQYIYEVVAEQSRVFEVWETDGNVPEGLPARRNNTFSSFVNIMYGCNNFCTYCIVPYVRGRERSRDAADILRECEQLVVSGVKEITLLGQNVNSYMGGGSAFAELIKSIDALGVERIRFMTSHPKDITDELISCFKNVQHLMPALHLPFQSGNNEILQRMNRRYTREKYLETVDKVRNACPEIGLTTDIIVGFPGESEAQFEDTLSLVEKVRFDAAYTFIYSPRKGTLAATYEDKVTIEEKTSWLERLIAAQQEITSDILKAQLGTVQPVLVEAISTRNDATVGGKTPRGHMVNFAGGAELIGKILPVRITDTGKNTLKGIAEAIS